MTILDPRQIELALMSPDTPMFSDVIDRVAVDPELSHDRRRDIQSGLRRVAKAVGRVPSEVPADAIWLQKRIAGFAPISANLTPKSWSNALSDARAGLVRFGIVERRMSRKAELSPEWRALWEVVLAFEDRTLEASLSRFVYFLNRLGVAPCDVSEVQTLAFRNAMEMNEIRKSPDTAYRAAVNGWNLAVKRIPHWPRQKFILPSRQKKTKLDISMFPSSFRLDLDGFVRSIEHPDPLDPLARTAPLRAATIKQYYAQLVRFASVLVRSGIPIGNIMSLADVVSPANAELGLRWMLTQTDNAKTRGIAEIAKLLRNVAKRYVRVDVTAQKQLDRLEKLLVVKPQNGMTSKNRARLRPLEDRATLRKLLLLPGQIFTRGMATTNSYLDALAREHAIAIAIFLNCPIRSKNMAEIHLEKNLQRFGDGRVFLVFEAEDVKNRQRIEFELPKEIISMIDRHVASRSPMLCPPGTMWLFPRRDGNGPMDSGQIASGIKGRVRKETGLDVNAHLYRHIAAMLWLQAHPGQYEALRRLLGHKMLSQTINAYAGFEAGTATRLFAEVLEGAKH